MPVIDFLLILIFIEENVIYDGGIMNLIFI